jgi:hypothetical protein
MARVDTGRTATRRPPQSERRKEVNDYALQAQDEMWDAIASQPDPVCTFQVTANVLLAGRIRTVRETLDGYDVHAIRARFQRRYHDIRGPVTIERVI